MYRVEKDELPLLLHAGDRNGKRGYETRHKYTNMRMKMGCGVAEAFHTKDLFTLLMHKAKGCNSRVTSVQGEAARVLEEIKNVTGEIMIFK
ncbi:hypothetical protein V6N11_018056 [Hibiscus sabdariffa]|uniref:Uncharacterized protein n=1 Tax=Hibiscus sabdariffa TaxID=183260 RepID=A0ABR2T6M3_9ROSI